MASWASKEFASIDLGDGRLKKRLALISERFAESPLCPINNACCNWAESKAAYRFFSNEKVEYQRITKSHILATKERCLHYSTVLAIQDTTYYNYTPHHKTSGLCKIARFKGKFGTDIHTVGLVMHTSFVVGTDGVPLGIGEQKIYSRPATNVKTKEGRTRKNRLPTEQKDSYRWVESLQNIRDTMAGLDCRIVTVADREADFFELFHNAQQINQSLVVRVNQNRVINKNINGSKSEGEELWDVLMRQPCAATIKVQIPKQNNSDAREAVCEVRFSKVTLNVPDHFRKIKPKPDIKDVELYAVNVIESECPHGCEKLEWMLYTNIAVINAEDALEKVRWYCLRWRIETWHKVIKSGLLVEECRLSTADRLIKYLAVMSIVAWRIFWITMLARVAPDSPCSICFDEREWKILSIKFAKKLKDKEARDEPTLSQAVKWLAQLGGFLARKCDGVPGNTHVWRGMKKLSALIEGAELKLVGNS